MFYKRIICLYLLSLFKIWFDLLCFLDWRNDNSKLFNLVCDILFGYVHASCPAREIESELIWPILPSNFRGNEALSISLAESIVPAKSFLVSVVDENVIRFPEGAHFVILETLAVVEIEHKQQRPLFKDNQFVFFVSQSHKLVSLPR